MASGPVLSGKIPSDGVLALLRDIEVRRTSGTLRAKSPDGKTYDILLVAGHMAMEQESPGGVDPVEAALKLRSGTYELFQKLPELPISKGDAERRSGSLAVHVPADLMQYCESAGLTGLLILEREGRRLEAAYDRGELSAIRLDGRDDVALGEAFAWEDGTFVVEARATLPDMDEGAPEPEAPASSKETPLEREKEKAKRKDDTGMRFLKVVEVALTSIVDEREKRRSPTRTSPPLPPPPAPRARPATEPPPPRPSRPDTVKVIYLRAEESLEPADHATASGARHVRTDVTGETVLPDAKPERKPRTRSTTGSGSKPDAPPATPSDGTSEGSYIVLLLITALAVLAAAGALMIK